MLRHMLIAKIHRATVTGADVNYIGSITIDSDLMKTAGILEWESVQVADITNGERLDTYVIPGEPGTGTIQLNGAAAHLVHPGDLIIIMAYAWMTEEEIKACQPRIIFVDEHNQVTEIREA